MTTWPLVHENDDGIRPAGKPDECFYCQQKVGQPHGPDCVCVKKLVELKVEARLDDGTTFTGLWQHEVPHFWGVAQIEFHKNESSWCANTLTLEEHKGSVIWDDDKNHWPALHANKEPDCLCGKPSFTFVRVVDPLPRRDLTNVKK